MKSFPQQQATEILNRATQKSSHLTSDDLIEIAQQSSIPQWCVEEAIAEVQEIAQQSGFSQSSVKEAIAEVRAEPDASHLLQTTQSNTGRIRSSATSKSCYRFMSPCLLLIGSMLLLESFTSVVAGEALFQSYKKNTQPLLKSAASADTILFAEQNLNTAIDWFDSQDQDKLPSQVNMAIAQLENVESLLEAKQNSQLNIKEQEAIALATEVIDSGYQSISAGSQIQRILNRLSFLLVFGCYGFYLGLAISRSSKMQLNSKA
jgi:hypothetical protein